MKALISGSLAYDIIMVFDDCFKNHILPDRVHTLNVCFVVPKLRREFGGCAGNVAYNLNLLGGEGHILATVGEDFGPYAGWLQRHGIGTRYVETIPGAYTAQAFITSDQDDNQITAFHPGAMDFSHRLDVPRDAGITIGTVSPDGPEGIKLHARQFAEAGIPFIFDPGQGMPMFNGEELRAFIERASYVAVNDYEASLLTERTGWSAEVIAAKLKALVVTRGGSGSLIYVDGRTLEIPVAPAAQLADPTGCGDAYRAGLLFGLERGMDWAVTGRIASLAGSIKMEHHGTQQHRYTMAEFATRYRAAFGQNL